MFQPIALRSFSSLLDPAILAPCQYRQFCAPKLLELPWKLVRRLPHHQPCRSVSALFPLSPVLRRRFLYATPAAALVPFVPAADRPPQHTMASLNLSINGPSIKSNYNAVVEAPVPSSNSPTFAKWALFNVQTPLVSVFESSGSNESVLKVESTGGKAATPRRSDAPGPDTGAY